VVEEAASLQNRSHGQRQAPATHAWAGHLFLFASLLVLLAAARPARAEEISVAVAANFVSTLEKLAPAFEQQSGHKLVISGGATGALYAQIKAGAPFEVFLAADAERPAQLEQEGLAVRGTRFVYAQGKLVLWSAKAGVVDAQGKILRDLLPAPGTARSDKATAKVSLADPALAPYGAAAQEVLSALGIWQALQERGALVLGTSITQAYQFASTGNVLCGFVAYAQVREGKKAGSLWKIPQHMYRPLLQEAVLLKRAEAKQAARAFLAWLATDKKVLSALHAAGYERPKS
jgi:molybdate transport system substrate-binding protein